MILLNKRLDEKFQPHLPGFKSDYDLTLTKALYSTFMTLKSNL